LIFQFFLAMLNIILDFIAIVYMQAVSNIVVYEMDLNKKPR